ncbi:flagellar protein [Enterobacter cancerogenus]|uniref:flagellar export protein FliJ n=1 Tax=Enterobacter cancerogenus TaxID=69218 RepID=UPI0019286886|nr:flagellar export protein FliJ [Enterobacter cancerogenus]CAD5358409.1 flagellar protein [Enterobacter cancerogenus]
MASKSPMTVLRDLAQHKLDDTALHLGKAQQHYQSTIRQHQMLETYQAEYHQALHVNMAEEGMSTREWINRQSFIDSLAKAVHQHTQHVNDSKRQVDQMLVAWRNDKQRLSAFETLQIRVDAERARQQSKQEQKMMDEFAQRASQGKRGI